MISRFHRFVDVENLAILTNVVRPAIRHPAGIKASKGISKLLFWVGQDWVVEIQTLCEVGVLLNGVDTRSEVGDIKLTNQLTALTERFAFLRSATGESLGVPGDDECLLSFELF